MENFVLFPASIKLSEKEAMMVLACWAYSQGKVSLGKAAEMVGLSKREFMSRLGEYGFTIFNYPSDEIENDLKNAQRHSL